MKGKEFDERQLLIRGKVFFHGFMALTILLLINAWLQSFGILWASGFQQHVVILMIAVTVTSVEAILRGAYFVSEWHRKVVVIIFGILSVILLFLNGSYLYRGAALVESKRLTVPGFSVVVDVLFITITAVGIVKEFIARRQSDE